MATQMVVVVVLVVVARMVLVKMRFQEKRVRRDIGAWKGAVVVIVVVGVVVLVKVADGDPLTTLIMVTQVKVVGKEEIQIDRSSS